MGERQNAGAHPDLRIAHNAICADRYAVTQRHAPFNHHVHVDTNIASTFETAADIEPRTIADQYATRHELISQCKLMLTLKLLQLLRSVHTPGVKIIIGTDHCYRHIILPGQPEHIGQIVL